LCFGPTLPFRRVRLDGGYRGYCGPELLIMRLSARDPAVMASVELISLSFYHLVSARKQPPGVNAEHPRGIQVEHEFEFIRFLDRQIARLSAF
jgi:hypothetical protein